MGYDLGGGAGGGEEGEEKEAEGEGEADDDENVKVAGIEARQVDPEEEEAFAKELKSMMSDSLAERRLEKRALGAAGIAIPTLTAEGSKGGDLGFKGDGRGRGGRGVRAGTLEGGEDDGGEDGKVVAFRVLVKKGNKTQAKEMLVPSDSAMAIASRKKEEEEERERREMKRRVLEYNEREGEDGGSVGVKIQLRGGVGHGQGRSGGGWGTIDEGLDALSGTNAASGGYGREHNRNAGSGGRRR